MISLTCEFNKQNKWAREEKRETATNQNTDSQCKEYTDGYQKGDG